MGTLRCPKCKSATLGLVHEEITPGAVRRCSACHGHFLSADAVDRIGAVEEMRVTDPPPAEGKVADTRTGLCPEGHGILRRARVEAKDVEFFLERCASCRGVWFDAGELSSLAAMHLLGQLEAYWDPDYQRARREAEVQQHLDDAMREAIGAATFEKLRALAGELRASPKRAMALAWLAEHLEL
jgi:Zn-finger nucleic acid-binding protein